MLCSNVGAIMVNKIYFDFVIIMTMGMVLILSCGHLEVATTNAVYPGM